MSGGPLPVVNGKRVIQALTKAGFALDRIVGSHHVLKYPGDPSRTVTVPVHPGRDLKRGTICAIIRQAGLTVEEFTEFLYNRARTIANRRHDRCNVVTP